MTAGFVGATCAVIGVTAGLGLGWLLWVGREALADGARWTAADLAAARSDAAHGALDSLLAELPLADPMVAMDRVTSTVARVRWTLTTPSEAGRSAGNPAQH